MTTRIEAQQGIQPAPSVLGRLLWVSPLAMLASTATGRMAPEIG